MHCIRPPPQVKLKDSLMSSITFSPARDAELAWVDGQIHFSAPTAKELGGNPTQNGGKPSTAGDEDSKELNMVPILDALTSAEARRRRRRGMEGLGSFPNYV